MIDIRSFASVQKLVWSRYLLNGEFDSPWKQIEIINLSEFHSDPEILFRAHASIWKDFEKVEYATCRDYKGVVRFQIKIAV